MKKITSLIFLLLFLFISAFSFTLAAEKPKADTLPTADSPAPIPAKRSESVPPLNDKYLIKAEHGKLLLYKRNTSALELSQSYDLEISLLPEEDRLMLANGIEAESLSTALQIIEDYLS